MHCLYVVYMVGVALSESALYYPLNRPLCVGALKQMRNNCHIDTRWRSFAVVLRLVLHFSPFRLLPSIIYTYNYSSTFAGGSSCPVAGCQLPAANDP